MSPPNRPRSAASAGATPRARASALHPRVVSHRRSVEPAASPSLGGGTGGLGHRHRRSGSSFASSRDMGKKARLRCASCGTEYKQRTDKSRFCSVRVRRARGAVHRSRGGEAVQGHGAGRGAREDGDVPPAFAGASVVAAASGSWRNSFHIGVRRLHAATSSSSSSDFDSGTPLRPGRAARGHRATASARNERRSALGRDSLRPCRVRPITSTAVLQPRPPVVISGPGPAMDEAVARCEVRDVIAVDCEGVNNLRVGAITLLQVAAGDSAYLFDVQAMGIARASR